MAVEVEAKAKVDPESARQKLKEAGAVLLAVEEQEDVYFEHPCWSLFERDEALRLRMTRSYVELTYKGPREPREAKSRLELTVRVSEVEAAERILELLGFKEAVRVRKRRELYELGGARVALDEVEGLGHFIEVEGGSEGEVLSLLKRLGAGQIVRESYAELLSKRLGKTSP